MASLRLAVLAGIFLLTGGCFAKSQTIRVETSPPGAAISVDSEYIGRSPARIKFKDIRDYKQLHIVAEKAEHDTATKTIKKRRDGKFPKQVFLKLEPTRDPARLQQGSQPSSQQGGQQTTIQGPTIIIPGLSPTPQVIKPDGK